MPRGRAQGRGGGCSAAAAAAAPLGGARCRSLSAPGGARGGGGGGGGGPDHAPPYERLRVDRPPRASPNTHSTPLHPAPRKHARARNSSKQSRVASPIPRGAGRGWVTCALGGGEGPARRACARPPQAPPLRAAGKVGEHRAGRGRLVAPRMRRWAGRVAERREEQFVIGKAAAAGGRRRARRGAEVPGPGELPGSQPSPAPREGEEKCGWREPLSIPPSPRLVGRAVRARLPRERFNGRVRPRRGAERAGGLLPLEVVAA